MMTTMTPEQLEGHRLRVQRFVIAFLYGVGAEKPDTWGESLGSVMFDAYVADVMVEGNQGWAKFYEARDRAEAAERENADLREALHEAVKVDDELRAAGIEYPLGARGVHDLAGMLDGAREALDQAEAEVRAVKDRLGEITEDWARAEDEVERLRGQVATRDAQASEWMSEVASLTRDEQAYHDRALTAEAQVAAVRELPAQIMALPCTDVDNFPLAPELVRLHAARLARAALDTGVQDEIVHEDYCGYPDCNCVKVKGVQS
jgi:hypothetical protein